MVLALKDTVTFYICHYIMSGEYCMSMKRTSKRTFSLHLLWTSFENYAPTVVKKWQTLKMFLKHGSSSSGTGGL